MDERDTVPSTVAAPLAGLRVLVTRAEDQAADFIARLEALGAEPLVCPTIRTVAPEDTSALDAALANLDRFDWLVFTSMNGVRYTFERLKVLGMSVTALANLKIAAIGPATAETLVDQGLRVDFVPRRHVAEAFVEEFTHANGAQVLLPLADIARTTLHDGLQIRGAQVTSVVAYRTLPVERATFAAWLADAPRLDVATFTSSSTVRNFVALAGESDARHLLGPAVVACIGPATAETTREHGITVDIVPDDYTTDGLLQAIVAHFHTRNSI